MSASFKVGLIVDDEYLSKYDYELVHWALSSGSLRISHLLVQVRNPPAVKRPLPLKLLTKSPAGTAATILWKAKDYFEQREVAAVATCRDSERKFACDGIVPGRIFISPQISKSGLVFRYSQDDLERIRREQFDLLIRCGAGILRGGILQSARLGILSFHHGDNRVNRGGPAAFWEVYHGCSRTGFIIQILTDELDGGNVLLRGFVPTQPSHLVNRAVLFEKSYFYLRGLLEHIAASGSLPSAEPHRPYSGRLCTAPDLGHLSAYILKRAWRSVRGRTRTLRKLTERWGVCFARSDWPTLAYWRGRRIPTPAGRFLADPFVVTRLGRTCVFVEDFVCRTQTGHITAFELGDSGARELGVAVQEQFHLSFPFLFEYQDALFMCPESLGARQIRIYRCTKFPLEWKLECIAMNDVAAVDSMLFCHGGLWWLLTNRSTAVPSDCGLELHIFSAPDPLSGKWEPHPRNPVLIDSEYARNGGLLRDGEGLVRVCQGQGFGNYGEHAHLMRITRLDRAEYAEAAVCRLTPDFLPGAHGTHHLHSDGIYSVWDYKRWERTR